MNYTFVDGSGNAYKLLNTNLAYSPMKAEYSSSGIYDGGEPFSKELGKMELIKLVDVFEIAFWTEDDHTDKKTMGSGTLTKVVGQERKGIFLKRNSKSMKSIEAMLNALKPED